MNSNIKSGKIIEYTEYNKSLCAVVLKTNKKNITILTENNYKIIISHNRVYHLSQYVLNIYTNEKQIFKSIKQISLKRNILANKINVAKLWQILSKKPIWMTLKIIAKIYFNKKSDDTEQTAILRALNKNKIYFKFKTPKFFPNPIKKIFELKNLMKKELYYKKLINNGSFWIKNITSSIPPIYNLEIKKILCSNYVFGKKCPYYNIVKKILSKTNIQSNEKLFNFIMKTQIWNINENIDLFRLKIPTKFSYKIIKKSNYLANNLYYEINTKNRADFTKKYTLTIDGINTSDFDDALSIEKKDNYYLLGIHISDVAHYIKYNDILDKSAQKRICSIYMPDMIIPMIPSILSENICSLKKGKIRPTISTIIKINKSGSIMSHNIFPSIIKVDKQLNYCEADKAIYNCDKITNLYNLTKQFRKARIKNGAIQITLPEFDVQIEKSKINKLIVKKIDKNSPSRMIITEIMILTNWISAEFLKYNKIPAIFRSQSEPKNHTLKKNPDSLFNNWMQKKLLKKLSLNKYPKRHCILGLNSYVTTTSPIRKYSDLVTQRQIRAAINMDRKYTSIEIENIIQKLSKVTHISKIQISRKRYWLLKYLENKIGDKENAIILQKKNNFYNILIKTYMLECILPQSTRINLKPKDIIQIKIQYVSARNNVISVFMS